MVSASVVAWRAEVTQGKSQQVAFHVYRTWRLIFSITYISCVALKIATMEPGGGGVGQSSGLVNATALRGLVFTKHSDRRKR